MVTWICQACGKENEVESCTGKRYLKCGCGRNHVVTGLHVDGKPIIHLIIN